MGVLNIGKTGQVTVNGETHTLDNGELIYIGMGSGPVQFSGEGRFYITSAPAHRTCPTKLIKLADARRVELGARETANERTIIQFLHPEVCETCQLAMGYTQFQLGSLWNTMPAHTHDRRMEAYLYFDMPKDARVFHFMGEPAALVTGANTGIGQAIAEAMGRAGAHVICAGRSSCAQTASRIASAEALTLDFADPMAAKDTFSTRQIDILVNNAGIIRRDDSVSFSESDWDDVMDVNLKAAFFTCQAFAKAALPRGAGKIVNIASLLSHQGGIRVPSYTASKHGMAGLTKIMANEWAASGINVNAIAPGYIKTNNTQALQDDPDRNKAILVFQQAAGARPKI